MDKTPLKSSALRWFRRRSRVFVGNIAWLVLLGIPIGAGIFWTYYFGQQTTIFDFSAEYIARATHLNNPPITPSFFYGSLPARIRRVRSKTFFAARTIWIYAEMRFEDPERVLKQWERSGLLTADTPRSDRFWLFRPPPWLPGESDLEPHYLGRLSTFSEGEIHFPADVYRGPDAYQLYFVMKDGGAHRDDDRLRKIIRGTEYHANFTHAP